MSERVAPLVGAPITCMPTNTAVTTGWLASAEETGFGTNGLES